MATRLRRSGRLAKKRNLTEQSSSSSSSTLSATRTPSRKHKRKNDSKSKSVSSDEVEESESDSVPASAPPNGHGSEATGGPAATLSEDELIAFRRFQQLEKAKLTRAAKKKAKDDAIIKKQRALTAKDWPEEELLKLKEAVDFVTTQPGMERTGAGVIFQDAVAEYYAEQNAEPVIDSKQVKFKVSNIRYQKAKTDASKELKQAVVTHCAKRLARKAPVDASGAVPPGFGHRSTSVPTVARRYTKPGEAAAQQLAGAISEMSQQHSTTLREIFGQTGGSEELANFVESITDRVKRNWVKALMDDDNNLKNMTRTYDWCVRNEFGPRQIVGRLLEYEKE